MLKGVSAFQFRPLLNSFTGAAGRYAVNEDGYSFTKQYRLLSRQEFLALATSRQKKSFPGFLIVWSNNNQLNPRIGITASRKSGNAVVRNRAKRLIRECFRHHCHTLPAVDINIVVRRSLADMTNSAVMADLLKAFQQIG